jgi:hypothetical protein
MTLWLSLALYCGATLLHFAHNAHYAGDYPNLPPSLTAGAIYAAWLGLTAVGLLGGLVYLKLHRVAGLALLAVYAALGFDGLLHYGLAPMAAHTPMMNFTIGFEAAMAAVLLAVLARQWKRS